MSADEDTIGPRLLGPNEIDLLRGLIGSWAPNLIGTCVDVRARDSVIKFFGGCHIEQPEKAGFLTISDDWVTTPNFTDFHNLYISFNDKVRGLPGVYEADSSGSGGKLNTRICSIYTGKFIGKPPLIRSIEVLSFECKESDTDSTLFYDRALRFVLDDGFSFVLSTEQGPIMGGVDFNEGPTPFFPPDEGLFQSRITIN